MFSLPCQAATHGQELKETPKAPAGNGPANPKTDQQLIQGTWNYVFVTAGGKKLEKNLPRSMAFTGNKVRYLAMTPDGAEVIANGTFKLDPSRKPKEIDLIDYGVDGGDKGLVTGIYELDGDILTICHVVSKGENRPTTLESKEGSMNLVWTLKRVNKDKPKLGEPKNEEAFTAWGKEVGGLQAGLSMVEWSASCRYGRQAGSSHTCPGTGFRDHSGQDHPGTRPDNRDGERHHLRRGSRGRGSARS
jgi:uncharacterized protein (TIGR03067 family)